MTKRDPNSTDRYGGGQSGYGSGRKGDDPSMGPNYRNQAHATHEHDDEQGVHTDERFTGRGGPQYWEDGEDDDGDDAARVTEKTDYNSGYNRGGVGYGGYPAEGAATSGKERSAEGRGNQNAEDSVGENKTERLRRE